MHEEVNHKEGEEKDMANQYKQKGNNLFSYIERLY